MREKTDEAGGCCERAGRTAGGRFLCADCRAALAAALGALPGLYRECAGALGRGPRDGLREKVTGGPLPGLALNSHAVDARATIVAALASWSGRVARERRVPAPPRDVAALAAFLLANLDWLSCRPEAREISADVARAGGAARRVTHPDAVKRITLGRCVAAGCAGTLTATVRPGAGAGGALVRCATDPGHVWDGPEWTALRRQMSGPAAGDRWLAAADIARLWRTPAGTVYRLASEQKWRRVLRSGRSFYAETDVHETFARRAARVSHD